MIDNKIKDLALEIVALGKSHGVLITTAESCTGGMVGAAITAIPGSSNIYERGFVTYSNQSKIDLVSVNKITLDTYGAVSEEIAAEMALGAIANSLAQISVSITGIAGPGGSEYKPEGRVCFAIAQDKDISAQTVEFGPIGRDNVRRSATLHALNMLHSALKA